MKKLKYFSWLTLNKLKWIPACARMTWRVWPILNKFKWITASSLIFIIKAFRPLLGPRSVCIYQISCTDYAEHTLKNKNIFIAFFLITFRVLSCNPLGALFLKFKYRNFNKK